MLRPILIIAKSRTKDWSPFTSSRHIVEEVWHMRGLMQVIVTRNPEVVLLAMDLPGMTGVDGIRELRRLNPHAKIIVLANKANDEEELEVLRLGARGYCRPAEAAVLMNVIEKVQQGEVWAARRTIGSLFDEFYGESRAVEGPRIDIQSIERLTVREREILRLLADGSSNKEIANALNVAVSTIKAHLTKIFRKLGQPDRVHLALLAAEAKRHDFEL